MPTPYKCPRCGLANSMGSTHCQACGTSLSTRAPLAVAPIKTVLPSGTTASNVPAGPPLTGPSAATSAFSFYESLLRKKVEGQVIRVEPPYLTWRSRILILGKLLIRLTLLIVAVILFGPIILGFLFALVILWLLVGFLFPQSTRSGSGCLSSLTNQMFGFFLTKQLFGPKVEEPVRDVRLRDTNRQESLVRMKGDSRRNCECR